jgi:hypothetical protein
VNHMATKMFKLAAADIKPLVRAMGGCIATRLERFVPVADWKSGEY